MHSKKSSSNRRNGHFSTQKFTFDLAVMLDNKSKSPNIAAKPKCISNTVLFKMLIEFDLERNKE